MRAHLTCVAALVAVSFTLDSAEKLSAQVFDSPAAAAADADFLVQGEYAGNNKAIQVIARGDGDFEIVVYELGLPGAGWNKSPTRRLDGDADTVAELVESMGLKRVERASPTIGAVPPADAFVLFDGSEQSLREHWNNGAKRTDDGLLIQGATTKDTFVDYRLHLEFMLPFMPKASGQGRGNSGVYHQGRYETQVLDSFGLDGKNNETGGIYETRDPDLNMCLPPLTWQTYDVEFTAARFDESGKKVSPARITANVNGVPVQSSVEVPKPTRAAPLNESPEPGPIYLQDHGNPVRFRNIWIVPRDIAKESRRPIVSGYERFFADADPKLLGGRILIESLGCKSCHANANSAPVKLIGPVLDRVSDRIRVDHLVRFIATPREVKPGTTMPDPWHGLADDKRQSSAIAIANYLIAGKSGMLDQVSDSASVDRGKALYHNQGCVACHAAQDDTAMSTVSVPLGDLATKYTLGSLSKFLLDPVSVRPCGRMPKVVANAIEAREIASYLLRDVVLVPGAELIRRRIYRGEWDKLPEFAALKPEAESQVDGFKIDDIKGSFAASYDAFLQITEAGNYTFRLRSDDGARLLIDGKTVIDHDGIHPASEKSKQVKLEIGVHPIRVLYFEGGGQRELRAEIESDSIGAVPLTSMIVASVDGSVKSLLPTTFKPDRSLVAEGEKLFSSAGCVNCHAKANVNASIVSSLPAKPLAECRIEHGCLANEVPAGLPNYELTINQRQRIAAAIKSVDILIADQAELVQYTMASLNCYACHVRDNVGGPESTRNAFFTTTTPEMGDEGRLPPNLGGVGDKLNEDYLRDTIANGADERSYMKTRMPGFGNALPASFAAAIVALDRRDEGHDGKAIATAVEGLRADGRTLCGNDGLACIKCHTFGGVGLPGIQAIDMLRMPKRLRRDWFERYLMNPQTYRPGTRMPASFIDGKSVLVKIAEGNPADQMEAMWQYLLLDKEAKPPSGLSPDAIELKDPHRAIIYRNFFTGVSPRGIAVGYPESVNVIWDAERMTLTTAWKNGFIDASKHWTGRGTGTQEPLGDALISIDRATPVAMLVDQAAPWPNDLAAVNQYQFLGYNLDKRGQPTFRYRVGNLTVEDKPEPQPTKSSVRSLNRQFKFNGAGNVTLLVATGKIVSEADNWYAIDNRFRVRVVTGDAKVVSFGDNSELRVDVSSPATIAIQIVW